MDFSDTSIVELAAIVAEHLRQHGIDVVLLGGLAAFMHWKDRQSLVQAVAILLRHKLKPSAFKEFCTRENNASDYELLRTFHRHAKGQSIQSMELLESVLTQLLLKDLK